MASPIGSVPDALDTFTPGPWFVATWGSDDSADIISESERLTTATLRSGHPYAPVSQLGANARLIAEAPALVEALEAAVLEETDGGLHTLPCDEPNCWVDRSVAALARIRGEAP